MIGHKRTVGVEITPSGVKIVALKLGRKPEVLACTTAKITAGAEAGPGLPLVEATQALQDGLQSLHLAKHELFCLLPETAVFRKLVEVPAGIHGKQLRETVGTVVGSFLPVNLEDMELDYQHIPANYFAKPDAKIQYLAIAAVEKRIVQEYLAVADGAKCHIKALDTVPAALARALIKPQQEQPTLLVAVFADEILVALIQHGVVWATAVVKAISDPSSQATAVADEVVHVLKFYTNRTGVTTLPTHIFLVLPASETFQKQLAKDSGLEVVPAQYVLRTPSGTDYSYAPAIGTALYPLYDLIP